MAQSFSELAMFGKNLKAKILVPIEPSLEIFENAPLEKMRPGLAFNPIGEI